MDSGFWAAVEASDARLAGVLRETFKTGGAVCRAFEGQQDAVDLVMQAFRGTKDETTCKRLGTALFNARSKFCRLDRQETAVILQRVCRGPNIHRPAHCDAGEIYSGLVANSTTIGLELLQKSLKAKRGSSSSTRDEAEKERWALKLAEMINDAGLPAGRRIEALDNSVRVWVRAFGARRAKTLRNRYRAWAPVADWLQFTLGRVWPINASDLVQYLEERHDVQPMGKSVPRSILSSLTLLEQVGQVDPNSRLSEDDFLLNVVKSWESDLDVNPRKVAQLMTVAMLLSSELLVCRGTSEPLGKRFYAFVLLLMHWSALRCDDLQFIAPESITLSQLGLRATLSRTKTSGPGKKVSVLQAFVMRGISLTGYDWLKEGYNMLHSGELSWSRDFLAVPFNDSWETQCKEYLEPEGVALHLRRLVQALPTPTKRDGKWGVSNATLLVPRDVAVFWTGHSARHWLPSVAAAAQVSEEHRDFIGRWSAGKGGSNAYVLTSRQVVHSVQVKVCTFLLEGSPAPGYVEEELHQSILEFCAARGLDTHFLKRHQVLSWDALAGCWSFKGKFPLLSVAPEHLPAALGDPKAKVPGPDIVDEDAPEAPYFVTVSRKNGFRRLHMSQQCAVRQARCIETFPVFDLKEGVADAICKLCKPKIQPGGETSSDSGSGVEPLQSENPDGES